MIQQHIGKPDGLAVFPTGHTGDRSWPSADNYLSLPSFSGAFRSFSTRRQSSWRHLPANDFAVRADQEHDRQRRDAVADRQRAFQATGQEELHSVRSDSPSGTPGLRSACRRD